MERPGEAQKSRVLNYQEKKVAERDGAGAGGSLVRRLDHTHPLRAPPPRPRPRYHYAAT